MKFWLVLWLFNLDGQFLKKEEFPFKDRAHCVEAAGTAAKKFVNRSIAITTFCVTDKHHKGLAVDPGIPMD